LPQYVANNCKAAGVPGAYTGAGATATITAAGGKGNLEAETSKAITYGVIWTPSFADLNVAVDYFDIQRHQRDHPAGRGQHRQRLLPLAVVPQRSAVQPVQPQFGFAPDHQHHQQLHQHRRAG
jgi:hypothetical protein